MHREWLELLEDLHPDEYGLLFWGWRYPDWAVCRMVLCHDGVGY